MKIKKLLAFGVILGASLGLYVLNTQSSDATASTHVENRGDIVKNKSNIQFNFGGRTAIVTGGTSGIGLATARLLVKSNCNVVIVGRNPAHAKIVDEINKDHAKNGVTCLYVNADVSQESEVKKVIVSTIEKFGSLDFMVCSAGIGGANNAIADETLENWNKVNSVDYTGVMLCNKYAIEQMLKQGKGGSIVNIASMFGLVAVPSNVAYSAAKGGVVNMTRAAGTAYADKGIRVNCLCPGVIDTPLVPDDQKGVYKDLHPAKRIGTPEEVAETIAFFLSNSASFITGTTLAMDGGYTAV